jgi:hypothetical protein
VHAADSLLYLLHNLPTPTGLPSPMLLLSAPVCTCYLHSLLALIYTPCSCSLSAPTCPHPTAFLGQCTRAPWAAVLVEVLEHAHLVAAHAAPATGTFNSLLPTVRGKRAVPKKSKLTLLFSAPKHTNTLKKKDLSDIFCCVSADSGTTAATLPHSLATHRQHCQINRCSAASPLQPGAVSHQADCSHSSPFSPAHPLHLCHV